MSQPLSTGITYQQVMQQPTYPKDPGLQAQVALEYFNDRVKPQLDAKGVKDPAMVEQARTEFFQAYKIPEIKQAFPKSKEIDFGRGRSFDQLHFFSATPGEQDQLSAYLSVPLMALGGVTTPAHDLLNPFDRTAFQRNNEMYQKAYPGIENDPGFLGDAYRLRTNRYTNMIGQGLGAFGAVRQIGQRLPETVLGKVPVIGKLGADARNAIASAGIFSGGTNALDVLYGKQNPLEGIGNTLLDVATAPLGGQSRLMNSAIQGAGGYASGLGSSLLVDITNGRAPDWERAQKMALEQAAIGAGMGAAFGGHKKPARMEPTPSHEPLQGRVTNTDEAPPPPPPHPPQGPAARKAKIRAHAETLHELMTSNDADERVQGKALYDSWKEKASDKKYRSSGRIKQPGDQQAREILAELSIIREQAKAKANIPKRDKSEIDRAVEMGKRARLPVESGLTNRKSDGTLKAQFENYLKRRFNQEDQRIINTRIGTAIKNTKAETAAVSKKVKDRIEKRQAKQEVKRKEAAKKAQEQKKAQIKAENERLKAELKKQASEKLHENMPRVLSPDQIELQAERLFQHYQKGEKGTLEAQISKHRTASRKDFSKSGIVDKSRSDAINETHARVLDRFNQKKSEAETVKTAKKPENVVKARAENLKALEDNQRAGGSHDFNTGKGKQHPLRAEALRWEDVRDSITDPEVREWGDTIDAAMKTDGVVRVRYDSERAGDTGEFEHKELSPIDWGFNFSRDEKGNVIDTRVVFHAVNKNGHTGEYYLQPSDPNPKTGTVSMVLDAPVRLPGKKAFRNTDPNIYKGPREFKISDIMARPPRRNQGLTSEGQAKLIEARAILEKYDSGESVSAKDIKTVNRNAKKVKKDIKDGAKALKQMSDKMKTVQVNIENETVTAQDMKAMKQEIKETPNKKPIDEATNC